MDNNIKIITINSNDTGQRIDTFLSKKFPDYSRNYFSNLIKSNHVQINDTPTKSSYRLGIGDVIKILFSEKTVLSTPQPEKIPLNIIYENKDVIVVNKQSGLVVHPAAGHESGTLVNALIEHDPLIKNAVYSQDSLVSVLRPGLVHRLDKDTSGVLIIAKNAKAMHSLSRQIQKHSARKNYLGICFGWPKAPESRLINYLGRHPKNRKLMADIGKEKGKEAIMSYKVLEYYLDKNDNKISLIEFNLETGRTHQIRVQMSKIGHPILGDIFYFNKSSEKVSKELKINRQLLHSQNLFIALPGDNKATCFTAPIPTDFIDTLSQLTKIK